MATIQPQESIAKPPPSTRLEIIEEVDDALKKLHADELVELAARDDALTRLPMMNYFHLCWHVTWKYCYFFVYTWAWTIWNISTLPMALLDVVSQLYYAVLSCTLLFVLGISCVVLRQPFIQRFYTEWSKKHGAGLSLINSPKPDMLESLKDHDIQAALEALSTNIRKSPDTYTNRTFDLDVAKVLLLCASLIYERPENHRNEVVDKILNFIGGAAKDKEVPVTEGNANAMAPGKPLELLLGSANAAKIIQDMLNSTEDTGTIKYYAKKMGLEFHVVSELNSQGTSCCGLFYSPDHNFIILAFKGTSATEFDEWITDCSFTAANGGAWIRGFGNVQRGFMDRMFPAKVKKGARLPYDTIRIATTIVSDILAKHRDPDTEINVWFTGHSLGCAMAALAYSRANMEPKELGHHARVRDGYIFAAPLMCDVTSVNAFNNRLYHKPGFPRTLWRVTQGRDIVATGPPAWGNNPNRRLSPFNMFGFAHLGTELTMKNPPIKSLLSGHHVIPGCQVNLHTTITPEQGGTIQTSASPKENTLLKIMTFMTYVPIVNRMIDHCTFMYWDQLCRLQKGDAVWDNANPFIPSVRTIFGF